MNRRAPLAGYSFGNKRQYRRTVWARFADYLGPHRHAAQVALMPSSEGDEVDVALSKGFREENLHLIDKNPAIVAHLKRRYPNAHTYGVDFLRAVDRIAKKGIKLDAANFALTSALCPSLIEDFKALGMALSSAMRPGGLCAVTVQQGREKKFDSVLANAQEAGRLLLERTREDCEFVGWNGHMSHDVIRVVTIGGALTEGLADCHDMVDDILKDIAPDLIGDDPMIAGVHSFGTYRSVAGPLTMLWCIFIIDTDDNVGLAMNDPGVKPYAKATVASFFGAKPRVQH